ncbi:SuhB Archaeal fructose-1,6-bisphosphatase and related enzymes of inositol monophosphatase family [Candidatus Nanopelagicaceae bacterium]
MINSYLALAKKTALSAGLIIAENTNIKPASIYFDENLPREIKSTLDAKIERHIISELKATGLPILSEETPSNASIEHDQYSWIVDPIDGTMNYIRNFGESAISIALWKGLSPIFGVVYNNRDASMTWGGAEFGAQIDDTSIRVSELDLMSESVVCTGFPSRWSWDASQQSKFFNRIMLFAKVRMIGSASLSLVNLSRGSVDAYFEDRIMLWDVAAGLAILEGAGGAFKISDLGSDYSLNVSASNGKIKLA